MRSSPQFDPSKHAYPIFIGRLGAVSRPSEGSKFDFRALELEESFGMANSSKVETVFPLLDDFKCSKCSALMREPHLTSCGHHFCRQCIEPVMRASKCCPACHESGFQTIVDKPLERKAKDLDVHCTNRENGCQWAGKLDSLLEHVQDQCSFTLVNCKLESFGCKMQVPRKDLDAHASDVLGHMTIVTDHLDTQQQALEHCFEEIDTKTKQLERHIDEVESNMAIEIGRKSSVKWTSLTPPCNLLHVSTGHGKGVHSCRIAEDFVPSTAKEILAVVGTHAGSANHTGITHCITVFVEEKGVRYSKYIHTTTYKQDAYNNNTDNISLPMPTNRMLHIDVPVAFTGHIWCTVFLNGYR